MRKIAAALVAFLVVSNPLSAAVEIREVTSPGGFDAWLVEDRTIPFASIEFRFAGGGLLDPEGKRGLTHLMTGLIEEGAGELDARAFAAARDALAADLEFDIYDDAVRVSARFLTENRDEAVALLREALVNPRFDEDAVERVRGQVLSIIRSRATDPSDVAADAFDALAFGDHPYATPIEGSLESVTPLTRDDIVAAHKAALVKDRVLIGAAGDIGAEELGEILDLVLGDLPDAGAPLPSEAEVKLDGGLTVVPFDTPQAIAIFGHSGISEKDPDYFAALVANQVVGGSGRLSRLGEEVREKRGLTYGVGTYLVNYDHADLIQGSVASANDTIAEAIALIREEWARVAEQGVGKDELEEAKTYMTGAYPLRFDGNGPISRIMLGMQLLGLDPGYVERRNDLVNAVTREDVARVAKRLFRPEDLTFVVVGRPVGLESDPPVDGQ